MLGNDFLLGHDIISVDSKMRVFLPRRYGLKPGSTVCIKYNIETELFSIHSEEDLVNEFKRLEELFRNAKTEEEKVRYGHDLAFFSISIVRKTTVDTQGRITLSNHFNPNEKIVLVGSGDCALMIPEERFCEFTKLEFNSDNFSENVRKRSIKKQ